MTGNTDKYNLRFSIAMGLVLIVMINHSMMYSICNENKLINCSTKYLENETIKVIESFKESIDEQQKIYADMEGEYNNVKRITIIIKDEQSNKKSENETEETEIKNEIGILDGLDFDGEISQDCKDKAIELYSLVPNNIKTAIIDKDYKVIVSSNPWWTDGHAGTFYPFNFNKEQGNAIAIYAKSVKNVDMAVLHEIGHFIDNYCGERDNCERSPLFGYQAVTASEEWNIIYNSEKGISQFPSWATDCCEDYFAEVYWTAITETDWCKETIPKSYNFVMNYVNSV